MDPYEPRVTVDAQLWQSLSPAERADALVGWGLPTLVMASLDRSTMTITMRAPNADDLLAAFAALDRDEHAAG